MIVCADESCEAFVKPNKWAKIKANEKGWYFGKAGAPSYCPAHKPEWVSEYRNRAGRS